MIDKRSLFDEVEGALFQFEFGHATAEETITRCALAIKKALDADVDTLASCECEDHSHGGHARQSTSRGTRWNHVYGFCVSASTLQKVQHGLRVCPFCYFNCMKNYHLSPAEERSNKEPSS